jgi:hypothetical protein
VVDDSFFRELSLEEAAQFKKWARENYVPGSLINELWHPVVRSECHAINSRQVLNKASDYDEPIGSRGSDVYAVPETARDRQGVGE